MNMLTDGMYFIIYTCVCVLPARGPWRSARSRRWACPSRRRRGSRGLGVGESGAGGDIIHGKLGGREQQVAATEAKTAGHPIYICIYECIYICVGICMCMCVYVYICIYVCVCM